MEMNRCRKWGISIISLGHISNFPYPKENQKKNQFVKNLQLAEKRSAGGARGREGMRHCRHFCVEGEEEGEEGATRE